MPDEFANTYSLAPPAISYTPVILPVVLANTPFVPLYLLTSFVQVVDDWFANTVSAPIPVVYDEQLLIVTSVQLPPVHLPYFELVKYATAPH